MDNKYSAEYLKERICEIMESKKDKDPRKKIVTVHVDSELFLKMAYLFIAKFGE